MVNKMDKISHLKVLKVNYKFLEKNKGKNFIEINKFERENTIKKRYELYFPNWMRSKNFFVRMFKDGIHKHCTTFRNST